MKKVLFVVHTLQVGGAEKVLINLLKNINKEKYKITVFALVNDGIYVDEVKNMEGVEYKYLFNAFFKNIRNDKKSIFYKPCRHIMNLIWKIYLLLIKYFPEKLYSKFVEEKYDVEIAFLEGKVSKFVSHSTNNKSKKIAWIHTDINNIPAINTFKNIEEEKECYKRFDKIICVSEDVKKRFIEKTGITENLYIQMNPIDSKEIIRKSKEPITTNLKNKGLVVCSVGRLVKEKGYDRLLEVHNRLIKEDIMHTIWIVGEGKERNKLETYIKNNHLEATTCLIGYDKNPFKYLKNADIFVCSSRIEGLSSALIEATILEKIIITTNCPGTKEIVGQNMEAAIIVDNDTEALYQGLKKLLTDFDLREKLEQNIKTRSTKLNIDNVMKEIEKIIDD